ncbi:hypothetical protein QE410_000008 [Microbacterium sp. SORGH_AS 1204]|uniref:hypothetical protein n=1 Tax=Microbacterium sp. SORGH_AS_1204 TaxID=3041785 RepID=UPI002791FBB7|nr:hypothetical protein [Microbacterium sp. SORGH_AS_1204]MDQ1135209.1 hypothetical protein [Microbacterium sp. SORGH_AS_1204]
MAGRQILTLLAHGLLATSAVAPAGVAAWQHLDLDLDNSAVSLIAEGEPDLLYINGRAFVIE